MRTPFTLLCQQLVVVILLNIPRLATAQTSSSDQARQYLSSHRAQLGLSEADVANPAITDAYTDAHNGVTHVYLRQQHQGLEVLGTEMGLHFDRQGQLLTQTGQFVANLAGKAPAASATLSAPVATVAAAQVLHLTPGTLTQTSPAQTRATRISLRDEALSTEEIPTQLAYSLQADGSVKLVWQIVLHPPKTPNQWNLLVDAATGKVLQRFDRNTHEQIKPPTKAPVAIPYLPASRSGRPAGTDPTYNVFALPVEAPGFGPRTALRNPADATASPFGWHDTNGAAGAEFTTTRGNNTLTFVPAAASPTKADYFADGGANLNFDFAYDIQKKETENLNSALAQLFYMNNVMHDFSYQYGFTEAGGNFQIKNYSAKGKGGDPVRAVAQDPKGTYNAYFAPDIDGKSVEMHMFLWPGITSFKVTSPSTIAGEYAVAVGQIGPALPATPLTGKVVLVNDGSTSPTLACSGLLKNAADIKGNIALIDRGSCAFVDKVQAAQDAGAIAAIIINNQPDTLITMIGDYKLSIPSVAITLGDGNLLKTRIKAGETVTISLQTPIGRDGAFDNVVVAHEYTHGISNRLTGGPATVDCLSNAEQMGEGWSDFVALWLTTKSGDTGKTARSVGTYVMGETATDAGIRAKPYSTDMSVNDYTYAIIGHPYDEEHSIGEVWATVLWDLNWAMIERYGYSTDLYYGTAGNNKTMRLVMDGMKMQRCSPGFLDGRDAILAADQADFKGANQDLIWRVFARRGMGFDAVQGSSNDLMDNKAGFALPAVLATTKALAASSVELYPNPAHDQLTLRTFGLGSAPVQVEISSVLGTIVQRFTFTAAQAQQGRQLDLGAIANGVYLVRVTTPEGALTRKVVVQH